ncbi:MAG: thioredoxin family protein [Candidatus Obscuribacterales bacterium]|nr:thioredoxin family protein [Candidatus Obscuribacterales bacterium]
MARTDTSTSSLPKALLVTAALLFTWRLVDGVITFSAGNDRSPPTSVAWVDKPAIANIDKSNDNQPQVEQSRDLSCETEAELEEILACARAENKIVLLEFSARWSDACKEMESTSLKNRQVEDMVKDNFYPVRITDRLKEQGRNPRFITELQRKFRIFAFPTLVVVSDRGEPENALSAIARRFRLIVF